MKLKSKQCISKNFSKNTSFYVFFISVGNILRTPIFIFCFCFKTCFEHFTLSSFLIHNFRGSKEVKEDRGCRLMNTETIIVLSIFISIWPYSPVNINIFMKNIYSHSHIVKSLGLTWNNLICMTANTVLNQSVFHFFKVFHVYTDRN